MRTATTLYLDTCADPGWPRPFGKSNTNWYIVAGLVLTSDSDYGAHNEVERLLQKYIPDNRKRMFPTKCWEIHYHDIIYGKGIFEGMLDIHRKSLSDDVFILISNLKPVLFATAINKTQLKRIYGERAYDPRNLGLRSTIHRYSMYLDRENQLGSIIVDEEEYLPI